MTKPVKLLFLLLLLTMVGCSTSNSNEISVFNNTIFKIEKGEIFCDSNSINSDTYNLHLEKSNLQIPLFKCIESKGYSLFLGIPVDATLEKLVADRTQNQIGKPQIVKNDTLSSFFQTYEKNNSYYSEYCRFHENNAVYILAVSQSKKTSESLFTSKSFSDRFIQK